MNAREDPIRPLLDEHRSRAERLLNSMRGMVLLLLGVMRGSGAGRAVAALGLLVVAALGGFYLASLPARKAIAPRGVVFLHAGLAVAGFLVLLTVALAP